jgi:hypothetical protein
MLHFIWIWKTKPMNRTTVNPGLPVVPIYRNNQWRAKIQYKMYTATESWR